MWSRTISSVSAIAIAAGLAAGTPKPEPSPEPVAAPPEAETAQASPYLSQPLVTEIYTADPSAHVWDDGKIYIYPSHDYEAGCRRTISAAISTCAIVMSCRWMRSAVR